LRLFKDADDGEDVINAAAAAFPSELAAVNPDDGGALTLANEWLRKLSLSIDMLFFSVFSNSMLSTIVSRALSESELAVRRLCTE